MQAFPLITGSDLLPSTHQPVELATRLGSFTVPGIKDLLRHSDTMLNRRLNTVSRREIRMTTQRS